MKINQEETKVMLFNPSKKWAFSPSVSLGNKNANLEGKTFTAKVHRNDFFDWLKENENQVPCNPSNEKVQIYIDVLYKMFCVREKLIKILI